MPLAALLFVAAALLAVLGWALVPDVPKDRAAGDWPLAWFCWAAAGVLALVAGGLRGGEVWGGG